MKKLYIQGIPAFRDFTIRDPRYFVILFQAFLKKKEKRKKKKKSELFWLASLLIL
jgi:hypothetical protein